MRPWWLNADAKVQGLDHRHRQAILHLHPQRHNLSNCRTLTGMFPRFCVVLMFARSCDDEHPTPAEHPIRRLLPQDGLGGAFKRLSETQHTCTLCDWSKHTLTTTKPHSHLTTIPEWVYIAAPPELPRLCCHASPLSVFEKLLQRWLLYKFKTSRCGNFA